MLRLTFLLGKLRCHRRVLLARRLQLGRLRRLIALDERQLIDYRGDCLLDIPLVCSHPLDLGHLLLRQLPPVLCFAFLASKFVRNGRVLFLRGLQFGHLRRLIALDERQLIDNRGDLLLKPVRVLEIVRGDCPVHLTAVRGSPLGLCRQFANDVVESSLRLVVAAHFLWGDSRVAAELERVGESARHNRSYSFCCAE